MTATTSLQQVDSTPVAQLATRPDPASWYGALRSLGTHEREGEWIVSAPLDVASALATPALRVDLPPAGTGAARDLIAGMARFSDGAAHRRRREVTMRLLPPVTEIATWAADLTAQHLNEPGVANVLDVMPLARTLPAEALARGLGLGEAAAASAADLTGKLCDALASGAPEQAAVADDAATGLCVRLRSLGLSDGDEVIAAASILFQSRDATAALIGATVLACANPGSGRVADRVEWVLRREAPVQCTRRTAAADTTVGAALVPRGSHVWIFLAAAEFGSGSPATFGSGPHGCPAADGASAIAREVVTVLDTGGWRPVTGQRIDYEPRPNLRMPRRVLVSRG